jgi:hypothetical protein
MVAAIFIQELSNTATGIMIIIRGTIGTTNQSLTAVCRGKEHFL